MSLEANGAMDDENGIPWHSPACLNDQFECLVVINEYFFEIYKPIRFHLFLSIELI